MATVFIIFCSGCILAQSFIIPKTSYTVWDNFYYQYYGVSTKGFSLYTYMFFILVFFAYPFINQNKYLDMFNGDIYYILIRHKSFDRWFKQVFLRMIISSFAIIAFLFLYTFLISLSINLKLENHVTSSTHITAGILAYQFTINGFLQLVNYNLILFIVICVTRKIGYILLISGITIVLGLPMINAYGIFPSALNSLGYLSSNYSIVLSKTSILLLYIFIELTIVKLLLNKKNIFFLNIGGA